MCVVWECLGWLNCKHPISNRSAQPTPPKVDSPIGHGRPNIRQLVSAVGMGFDRVSRTIRFTFSKFPCSPTNREAAGSIFPSQGHFRHFTVNSPTHRIFQPVVPEPCRHQCFAGATIIAISAELHAYNGLLAAGQGRLAGSTPPLKSFI